MAEAAKKEQASAQQKEAPKKGERRRKKFSYILPGGKGQMHVKSTYNNTIISFTDQQGNVICWSSAGKCGFTGPKKATPYAAGIIVRDIIETAKSAGVREVDAFLKGIGSGREAAVRSLTLHGVMVSSIKDITPVAHNGVRKQKVRRV